ncbi:DUF6545 domain-containing protein [Nocardia sp. GCM10030253]|uniref:DUF6545 domain-containing protein n=1 Tax=Nocardia sp. GCM10030253 TaxID=3273404 RepID=UPI0036310C2E
MTAVPTAPVAAITVFAILVAILRCIFVHHSATDRLINRALGLAGAGMLLRVATTGTDLTVVAAQVVAVVGFLTVASVYGVARMLDGANPRDARRRQRRYDLLALMGFVVTVLIDAAAAVHLVPAATPVRWQGFGAAISCVPLAVSGFLLMRASLREIRCTDSPPTERIAYSALICVASFWICYAVILLMRYRRGVAPSDSGKGWALGGFAFFAVIAALLGIPLVRMLLVRIGWDRDSRDCRRLRPLWVDLTAAVPHIALVPDNAGRRDPALRRYRMTIEIRDALLHLRRHVPDADPGDIRSRTLHIVRSAEAGIVAASATGAADTAALRRDLELRHLLEMAAQWPKAKRAILATDRAPRLSAAPGNR